MPKPEVGMPPAGQIVAALGLDPMRVTSFVIAAKGPGPVHVRVTMVEKRNVPGEGALLPHASAL